MDRIIDIAIVKKILQTMMMPNLRLLSIKYSLKTYGKNLSCYTEIE